MKKTLLVVLCMVVCIAAFASCDIPGTKHEHDWAKEWSTSETEHWYECTDEECTEVDSKGNHAGGNATCTEKAVCETCGESYGELSTHVYDKEVVDEKYLANAATCIAKATYYKSCVCGAKGSETFETGDFAAHTPAGTWSTSDTEHWYECTVEGCGIGVDKEMHTYDKEVVDTKYLNTEASCNAAATYFKSCECGAKGSETFVDGVATGEHNFGYQNPVYVQEGDNQHKIKCNGCDTYSAAADCQGSDDGDCTTAVVCVCERVLTAANESHTLVWKQSADAKHWQECEAANCNHKTAEADCNGGEANCQSAKVCADCGNTYGDKDEAKHTGTLTWDKTGAEADIGTYACGHTVTFDKLVDYYVTNAARSYSMTADGYFGKNIIIDTEGIASTYSKDLIDTTKNIVYSINGVEIYSGTDSFLINTNEVLIAHPELHGYQNIVALVTDIYGGTHEVLIPVCITTANISSYAEWIANVYPADGNTYGFYNLTAGINFATNAEPSAPKGAFKGTLIGNNLELIGSQGYGRHIFGALDGAHIENIRIRENGYRGSCTRNSIVMGLLGTSMKNTTLDTVTFALQGSDWASAIDISSGTGWLVGGEVSGNTMTNITVELKKTVNALAPFFGSQYSNNTVSGFTWTVADDITVPDGEIIIAKTADGEVVYLCDVTTGNHQLSSTHSYDDVGHWYECSACGAKSGYAVHNGTPVKVDDNTHKASCDCGYSSDAAPHSYTWDKTAEDKDVGTCACSATVEFDKQLDGSVDGVTRGISLTGASVYFGNNILTGISAIKSQYSYDLVDFNTGISYYINDQLIGTYTGTSGCGVIQQNATFTSNVTAGNNYNIKAVVTDIYGETHEIFMPIVVTE